MATDGVRGESERKDDEYFCSSNFQQCFDHCHLSVC